MNRLPDHPEPRPPIPPGTARVPVAESTIDFSGLDRTVVESDPDRHQEGDGFPAEDDLIHSRLGQYRMGPVIGRGSMARVYEAEHLGLGRTCAIKVMNPGLVVRRPEVVDRFWAEARAVAQLVHPHVVTVHNLGSDRGYHYIELEHVPGGVTVNELVQREGALVPLRATSLMHQVVLALGAAHRSGLVHRDVKPANVLLSADGLAKLADFGLVHQPSGGGGLTSQIAGTPNYMAPELFEGAEATARSDFYAVGIMYYYLLAGQLPFESNRLEPLITLHRQAPLPDLRRLRRDAPDEIVSLLERLLAKDPMERPDSAEQVAEQLRAIMGQLRDTEDLVAEALAGLEAQVHPSGPEGFRVVVSLEGGRLQEVHIEAATGRGHDQLIRVFSICAPATPDHHEFALRLNAELTHGSLSIRLVNDHPFFVMSRVFARRHVGAADIRAAVLEIARRGDWVEHQLTNSDNF